MQLLNTAGVVSSQVASVSFTRVTCRRKANVKAALRGRRRVQCLTMCIDIEQLVQSRLIVIIIERRRSDASSHVLSGPYLVDRVVAMRSVGRMNDFKWHG